MKKKLLVCSLLLVAFFTKAQTFSGQWKGGFIDKSTSMYSWGGEQSDYVLDLDVNGNLISGYSYTYFTSEGKKYYTICKVKGILDKKKKYVEVTETERTKTNIPQNITNSFQLHKLSWKKVGADEILEGTWEPAPGQDKSKTGHGTTVLSRRQLSEISPLAKRLNSGGNKSLNPLNNTSVAAKAKKPIPTFLPKQQIASTKKTPSATIAKQNITPLKQPNKPIIANKPNTTTTPKQTDIVKNNINTKPIETIISKEIEGYEKRKNTIVQTIKTESESVTIEMYDNGDIDGDSVSLFYNGNILVSHMRLTNKPIKLNIPVIDNAQNELEMYAENLGTIPPNTALLIVTDGKKRYELRITSDLEKSGVIKFVHNKKE